MKDKPTIWLIRVGETLPSDEGEQRLFRMGLIANELVNKNANVIWWASTFDHNKKEFRANKATNIIINENYHIQLLHGCGYKRNASIGRFRHYAIEKKQFAKFANRMEKPDLIYVAIPNIDLARAAVMFGKKNNIPVIVDIRDMWPDIYVELAIKAKSLVKLAIIPLRRQLKYTLKHCKGIFATSDKFLDWGLHYAQREKQESDDFFYVSYPDTNVPVALKNLNYWYDMGIQKDDLVCCFFGQFGYAVDLDTVMNAAVKLHEANAKVKFVICGVGEKINDYKEIVKNVDNVIFPGWVNRKQICELGKISHVGLLSYRKSKNYEWSMPNKFCEYLALGQALLIQPNGMMEEMAKKHNCGVRYDNVEELVQTLIYFDTHRDEVMEMKEKSRKLYDESFRADVVYGRLADKLLKIAGEIKS